MIRLVWSEATPSAVQKLYAPLFMGPRAASQPKQGPPRRQFTHSSSVPCWSNATMGNLVSFSTPKSEAANFHALSALDIDKQNVDFSAVNGKVRERPDQAGCG